MVKVTPSPPGLNVGSDGASGVASSGAAAGDFVTHWGITRVVQRLHFVQCPGDVRGGAANRVSVCLTFFRHFFFHPQRATRGIITPAYFYRPEVSGLTKWIP